MKPYSTDLVDTYWIVKAGCLVWSIELQQSRSKRNIPTPLSTGALVVREKAIP